VLQADNIVQRSDHRPSTGFGVAVCQRDRDFFMTAQHRPRTDVAAVVDQGVVQPPEACTRIERRVFDAKRAQDVDNQVRSVLRRALAGACADTGWLGDNHAATGILRSNGNTLLAYRSRKRR
jgi:hypothetical protein